MKSPAEICVTAHRTRQRPQFSAPFGREKSPAKPDPAANEANSQVLGGSFLDAWFQTLRCSQTYCGNCRSGQFSEESARQTYQWFGALDGLSLEQWWAAKGSAQFRESIVPVRIRSLKPTGRSQERVGGELWVSVPFNDPIKAGRLAEFACRQLLIFSRPGALLSDSPLGSPFFRGTITSTSIIQSVRVVEYHRARTVDSTVPMWQIGEELRLKASAVGRIGDSPRELADKHADMGKTVSGYLRRGLRLVENAARGYFPLA
jgi:hypothetical protein